jgi:hypothetical protein
MSHCNFQVQSEHDGVREIFCSACPAVLYWRRTNLPQQICDPQRKLPEQPAPGPRQVVPIDPEKARLQTEALKKLQADAAAGAEAIGDPTLSQKGRHYVEALARWFRAGCPTRTQAEAEEREAICRTNRCKLFDAAAVGCKKCGCGVSATRWAIASKTKMATEVCPRGFWE